MNGGSSTPGEIKEILRQTDDLEFVQILQQSLSPLAKSGGLRGPKLAAYREVQNRAAQLTGVNIARQELKNRSPDAAVLEQIRAKVDNIKFSRSPAVNANLATAARDAAANHIQEHYAGDIPPPLPTRPESPADSHSSTQPKFIPAEKVYPQSAPEIPPRPNVTQEAGLEFTDSSGDVLSSEHVTLIVNYFQNRSGVTVKNSADFKQQFVAKLQEQKNNAYALQKIAEQIEEDGEPLYEQPALVNIAKDIAGPPKIKRYSDLQKRAKKALELKVHVAPKGARFRNIKMVDDTSVKLYIPFQGEVPHQIHANYMPVPGKSAIATQYPPENSADRGRFWTMIHQHKTDLVIDLTQQEDRLGAYYPTQVGQTITYDNMKVTLTQAEGNLFTYEITDTNTNTTHTLNRFNYDDWKDKTALDVEKLSQLAIYAAHEGFQNICVHCKAGVGRTSTVYAAVALLNKIRNGEITQKDLESAVEEIAFEMKMARGYAAVQTADQLQSLKDLGQKWLSGQIPIAVN